MAGWDVGRRVEACRRAGSDCHESSAGTATVSISGNIVRRLVAACLTALCLSLALVAACAAGVASADVDTAGGLEKAASTLKTSPHEVEPLDTSASGDYKCSSTLAYSDVQNAAGAFVIGNCKSPWEIEVVSYSGPNGEGIHSYGGFVTGAFSGCGWIESRFALEKRNSNGNSKCGEGSTGEFEVSTSSFMERHNSAVGDGWPVVITRACPEYANYRPWSSNNIEQELVRTAPAYAASGAGSNYPAIKWRYITKYSSTDGSGRYVMVRDDRYNGGEGNWVFVPRSCLPANLPESEAERNPPPPVVSTTPASGILTPNATLNGSVDPEGVPTTFYFQYGKTTNYELSTPHVEVGAGTSTLQESAPITGLAPGTTYYSRIVATSATGTSYGNPQPFVTQPPPEATTSPASEIQQTQATLNGSVNPEGLDTKYHFEYGEYGKPYSSSTAVGDAGSGTGPVHESATATGLEPGITYRYRIVAESSAGGAGGNEEVFVAAPAYRPAALLHSNGSQDVFFTGTSGSVGDLNYAGSTGLWSLSEMGNLRGSAPAQGSASTLIDKSGVEDVFFTGTNGQIYEDRLISGVWNLTDLGSSVVAAGSPSAVMLSSGAVEVFFRGTNGEIYTWWASSGAGPWTLVPLGGEAAGDPSAIYYSGNNYVNVYFVGTNGAIWDMWASNGTAPFSLGQVGGQPAVGALSALTEPNGGQNIWFRGTNGAIWEEYWNPQNGQWTPSQLGGSAAGAPSGVLLPSGGADIYFRGTDSAIWQIVVYAGTVTTNRLAGATATGDPTALLEANGYQDVYFPEAHGEINAWFQGKEGWAIGLPMPSITATTNAPTALLHSNDSQDVFFTGTSGSVGDLNYAAPTGSWSLSEMGNLRSSAPAQGSASTLIDKSGVEDVFFTGTNGQIYEERLIGGVWTIADLGGPIRAAGNPSALLLNEGAIEVFFRATNKEIYVFWASSGSGPWTLVDLGGQAAGDPTAVDYRANNTVGVFFVGTGGVLWNMWAVNGTAPFGSGQMENVVAGGEAAVGTLSATEEPNGGQNVWYRGTNGMIWEGYWNPANGKWTFSNLGGEKAAGEPSGVLKSNGGVDVYYRGADSTIWQIDIYALKVERKSLGAQVATGDPTAVLENNGYQDVYFPDGSEISAWFQGSQGWAFANLGIGNGLV